MIRVGAVNYLNSKPLIEELAGESGIELVLDYPSRLVDRLGLSLDAALIPSIGLLVHPRLQVVSDACVAAHGPVLSVKLYARVPWGRIRSVALDEGSRTSAVLARILLAERAGVRPAVVPLPLEAAATDVDTDAVLLIGDRAMHEPAERFAGVWDLAEEWRAWTGLPFVFALWAGWPDRLPPQIAARLDDVLSAARDRGEDRLHAIAVREAPALGISSALAERYLTENLYYRLGPREREGMQRFFDLASAHGLAAAPVKTAHVHT